LGGNHQKRAKKQNSVSQALLLIISTRNDLGTIIVFVTQGFRNTAVEIRTSFKVTTRLKILGPKL